MTPCRDRNYVKSQEEFNEIEFFVEIKRISTVNNAIFGVDIVEIVSYCRDTEFAITGRRHCSKLVMTGRQSCPD